MKVVANINTAPPALREVGLRLAKVNGINLAQGLCLMPTPGVVVEAALVAIVDGHNLYSPAQGRVELRQAISRKLNSFNKAPYSYENIIVTTGATGAFEIICEAFLQAGDEVITFIPFYPYHRNALTRKHINIKYVNLHAPDWTFDFAELEKAFTPKTKFVLVTNPHNPTGKVFSRDELRRIGELCKKHGIFCVTDEVYEYMTYDGREHVSIASMPEMFDHTITMCSYSKTFAITGWRIGYLAAPPSVVDALRNISDQIYVCAPTPLQHGVTAGIQELGDDYYENLRKDYTRKRDLMRDALLKAGLEIINPQGAYYTLASTTKRFPNMTSEDAVNIMVEKAQVGAVPASDFLGPEVKGDAKKSNFLRFCFAVPDETLHKAGESLARL